MLFPILKESFLFALNALRVNKLRTFLSLLGITIGIFAIISVFTIVDSLEKNIRNSVESLGDNVVFVQKWPWAFGSDYPWWKYMNRPVPSINELSELQRKTQNAEAMTFLINLRKTVQAGSNSMENIDLVAASHNYDKVKSFELTTGRYFTEQESGSGKNIALIGWDVYQTLFDGKGELDNSFKLMGRKVNVCGIFKKEGSSILGSSADNQIVIPVNFARNLIDLQSDQLDPYIMVKAKAGITNDQLKDELTGVMRSVRKLKPLADDNFALNETSLLSKSFDSLFGVVGIAGWFIGGFSILVGGFGIANIMFVSVRERTNIIGIQKSLGAKNHFILMQFLIESVLLCIIGGSIGLLIIQLGTMAISSLFDMDLFLSLNNIILGLTVSASIGIVSGFVPAYIASRLNPVVAIRSGG